MGLTVILHHGVVRETPRDCLDVPLIGVKVGGNRFRQDYGFGDGGLLFVTEASVPDFGPLINAL